MKGAESVRSGVQRGLNIRRAVRLVWQSAPQWTLASMAFVFVQGLLPLLALWLMKLVVDAVTAVIAAPNKEAALRRVVLFIALAGGVALLVSLCRILAGLVSEVQAQAVTDHVSDILHAKSVEADLAYYESPDYYDALHRAQQQAPFRPPRIVHGLLQAGQSTISLVAIAQPREIPARIAPMAESGALRAAERQIGTERGDARSVVDRAGAVSGLNLGQPAA